MVDAPSGEDVRGELLRSIAERAAAASVPEPEADPGPDFRNATPAEIERELWRRSTEQISRHNLRGPT
jgi:hypothetical protein